MTRSLAPDVARRMAADEIAPAMVALVEQGGAGGKGFLASFKDDHTVLVVPREVEQLRVEQLLRLTAELSVLTQRVRRVIRFRTRSVPTP